MKPDPSEFYKVIVRGMPASSSWQDMKDFFRKCEHIIPRYAEITDSGAGEGIGGFSEKADAITICEELDDTIFKARNGETCNVSVKYDNKDEPRKRSRGRSPPPRERSRERSRRRSPPPRERSYSR